jgi:hypothetical protein
MKKFFKIVGIILLSIVFIICGLIVNNRVYYAIYSKAEVDLNYLTDDEVKSVASVFEYLSQHGDAIFDGFSETNELLIYNRKYEFLISGDVYGNGWENLCFNERLNKNIYRRLANNSQAFAVKIEDHWVGSFCTFNYFHVKFLETVPFIVPPQFFSHDEISYKSVFIHEMAHAFQGNRDYERLDKASHLDPVIDRFFDNNNFNSSLKQEGKILDEAIKLTDKNEITQKVKEFLITREARRNKLNMTSDDISNEKEFELLEGLGRYAEFIASQGSKSIYLSNLNKISQKNGSDWYYVSGFSQIILLKNLDIPDWQQKLFYDNYSLEDLLREYV